MALIVKDGNGTLKYIATSSGDGSIGDPFVMDQDVDVTDRAARDLGKVDIAAFDASLPAGTNAIGKLAANSGVDIGDVDLKTLPADNLGQRAMAASLSTVPASDIADGTYVGDIKFGENLPGIDAGETHIGKVSGTGITVPITLTVTNGVYTAQDVVGGLITMASAVRASGKMAYLDSLTLGGMTSAIAFELWLFNADLATPCADNAPFALVAADLPKVLGVIPITTDMQYQAGAGGVFFASVRGIGELVTAAVTTVYAYLKHTTTTSPGTTSLFFRAKYAFLS